LSHESLQEKMDWETIKSLKDGACKLENSGVVSECRYSLVSVYTGKQRVFQGYRLTIVCVGKEFIGEAQGENMSSALTMCVDELEAEFGAEAKLLVNGLDPNFKESGLSGNTGFGYIDDECVHMMDKI
jgi:hypothetical protein